MTKTETYAYKTILQKAKNIKKNVEEQYTLGEGSGWSYYIAKAIINKKKAVTKITVKSASKSQGDTLGRQIAKSDYLSMAKRLCTYVEKNNQLPNYVKYGSLKVRVRDFTYMFARILVWYDSKGELPNYADVNSKAFIKPTESTDEIYAYFVKVFGKITCIDDALEKIAGKGYGYYYDDHKSNKQTIDAIASSSHSDDPNCTDSTQMMKHVADGTGKYKKVDCIHVKCNDGDGHVFLKLTPKSGGSAFYRDPAAVLKTGVIEKVWCADGKVLAINPSWWLANLNR